MTPDQETQWREEFEEYFAATKPYQFSILKDKKKTEFEISKLKFSIGYVSARKKAQEDNEKDKVSILHNVRTIMNCHVTHDDHDAMELIDEIQQILGESTSQARWRLFDEIELLEKEISQLKEELKRERDTVDFYASSESWNHSGYATYAERHFAKISEKMKIDYDDAENYPVSIIGGKLARQTQQRRRIEL